jgi:hypothetical protein
MRYLCLVRWEEGGPRLGSAEEAALIREHLAYDERLRASGALVEAGALQLESSATLVRVRDGKLSATDGPFPETKEHLGGFFVIEAGSREEAVRIAGGIPSARNGWIEVRPFRDLLAELVSAAASPDPTRSTAREP